VPFRIRDRRKKCGVVANEFLLPKDVDDGVEHVESFLFVDQPQNERYENKNPADDFNRFHTNRLTLIARFPLQLQSRKYQRGSSLRN